MQIYIITLIWNARVTVANKYATFLTLSTPEGFPIEE